jgi:hypothetical protein
MSFLVDLTGHVLKFIAGISGGAARPDNAGCLIFLHGFPAGVWARFVLRRA